jgi:glyoxylate/hydroxypyruvate reductase A
MGKNAEMTAAPTVLLCGQWPATEAARWRQALQRALPEARWCEPTDLQDQPGLASEVSIAVVANPPAGALTMAETAAWAVLSLHRRYFDYRRQQDRAEWRPWPQRRADEVPVLVLGRGQMGTAVARTLAGLGYPVTAWGREDRRGALATGPVRTPDGAEALPVHVIAGPQALQAALPAHEVVVNLLPLTPQTAGLIDAAFLAALPPGAALVNLARGAHVVEHALRDALDRGHLRHAVLDVFAVEPLPPDSPWWSHPAVTVLPHAAAATDPRSASAVVASNVRALMEGRPLAHLVDRQRGY